MLLLPPNKFKKQIIEASPEAVQDFLDKCLCAIRNAIPDGSVKITNHPDNVLVRNKVFDILKDKGFHIRQEGGRLVGGQTNSIYERPDYVITWYDFIKLNRVFVDTACVNNATDAGLACGYWIYQELTKLGNQLTDAQDGGKENLRIKEPKYNSNIIKSYIVDGGYTVRIDNDSSYWIID